MYVWHGMYGTLKYWSKMYIILGV